MSLQIQNLHAHYGKSHVLQGVDLTVGDSEVVTLLGRNGAGKSTTLKAISGAVRVTGGKVSLNGVELQSMPAYKVSGRGICLVPEDRGIFKLLSVEENLLLGQRRGSPWSLSDIYSIFPRLKERRRNGGSELSGGEQQMLSIGRALLNNPKVLMLDEPVEGLAPIIVEEIVAQLQLIRRAGVSILLVEQNLEVCIQLADRHYVIDQGKIVYTGTNEEFMSDEQTKVRYLSVGVA